MAVDEGDRHLIQAVQRGDQAAWRDLIARYEGRLISFARRMCNDRTEAEDLVQETFLGLVRSLPAYDTERSLETYLFAILRNKLSDHLRRRRGGQRQSIDSLEVDDAPAAWLDTDTPSRYVAGRERIDAQRRALVDVLRTWAEQCTDRRRFQDLIVIEMLLVLGLRNKEVAADLGLTEPAVAGIKFRVIEQWRGLAAQALPDDAWDEADLAGESTLARLWQEEGISCLKRSTLGRFLLGAVDEDWAHYIDFHVHQADCDRCQANLADLRSEDEQDAAARDALRERCFTSSVGFLSRAE
ncbi:MAG: sigma-70 family RNA polymerase sigma factor [Phycisphaerales bacterium]|nr:sigma-70 family RNA polymerase sigma factor [Phycisphaerales bacterium]